MEIRLTQQQVTGIINGLQPYLKQINANLYLYGSRVNLEAKGGDIDLLLIFDSCFQKNNILQNKHYILSDIKKNIGEQKIDLLFASKKDCDANEFIKYIFPSAILMKKFC